MMLADSLPVSTADDSTLHACLGLCYHLCEAGLVIQPCCGKDVTHQLKQITAVVTHGLATHLTAADTRTIATRIFNFPETLMQNNTSRSRQLLPAGNIATAVVKNHWTNYSYTKNVHTRFHQCQNNNLKWKPDAFGDAQSAHHDIGNRLLAAPLGRCERIHTQSAGLAADALCEFNEGLLLGAHLQR